MTSIDHFYFYLPREKFFPTQEEFFPAVRIIFSSGGNWIRNTTFYDLNFTLNTLLLMTCLYFFVDVINDLICQFIFRDNEHRQTE